MRPLESLLRLLSEQRITRRDFIQRATTLGMAAAIPSAILSEQAFAAGPKKGGKFTIGIGHGSTTDSLDPATWPNDFITATGYARYNFLTEIDTDGNLIGELAESWETSSDAKTWVFKIRKGVEFHNGKSLKAQDVVDSINHHRGDDSKSAAKSIVDAITDIKADGGNVVIKIADGNADLPVLLSDYHLAIMPSKGGKSDWKSGMGTGGYVLTELEPGVRFRAKLNPNYWKAGRGHFDEIEMITIADVAARTSALTTGETDFMDRCDIKTVHLLERNKNVKVEELQGYAHYTIPMRTNLAPFDDNNIRLALKYALDREALLQTILRGHGYVGNDHPIPKSNPFFAADLPQRKYDADKAKFYLKKAGVSKLSVNLSAAEAAFSGAVDAAVLFKEHAAKAGINITVDREPDDGYWSNVWNTDNRKWAMCYWSGRPTADWMFNTAYSATAKWNDTNWQHAEFNRLLLAARIELDDAKRRSMYGEMQRIVSDEGGTVVPLFNNYIHAISKKVAHEEKMAANWPNDGHRYTERWWFA